jgi:hypothetical protein
MVAVHASRHARGSHFLFLDVGVDLHAPSDRRIRSCFWRYTTLPRMESATVKIEADDGPRFDDGDDGLSVAELERELPRLEFDMVPLGELLSRVAQGMYAELGELAETCVCPRTRCIVCGG